MTCGHKLLMILSYVTYTIYLKNLTWHLGWTNEQNDS